MTRAAHDKSSASAQASGIPLLDQTLFYVLLAMLAARPLISEGYERLEVSFLSALPDAGGPTPAATAWLDALLLATSIFALGRIRHWLAHGLAILGLVLLTAAVFVSSAAAGDKQLAFFAGGGVLIGALSACALAALVRTRWMLHLLLGALLATGCTTALKCIRQSTHELEQTREYWEQEYKPGLLRQGYEPDDPLLVNFERRMLAGEAHGFLGHPNVTASCLMIWLLVAGGLLLGGLRGNGLLQPALVLLLAVLLAAALWFTGSRGALGAGLVGLVVLVFFGVAARWCGRHARGLLALLLAGYVAVIAGVGAYGVVKGTLPHPSLAFRWYYWSAAGQAIQEAPLTGIGRENFAQAYMRYKPAAGTEEVRNPHNVWLSLLVETGPLGLAGGGLLALLVLSRGLRNLAPATSGPILGGDVTLIRAVPLVGGVLCVQAWFSGTPFGTPGIALVWWQDIAFVWTLSFGVVLWVLHGLATRTRGETWLAAGLCAGVVAALVHGLLTFALLTPGGLAVFVLCAVGAVRVRAGAQQGADASPPVRLRARVLRAVPLVALLGLHVLGAVVPSHNSAVACGRLDAALRQPPSPWRLRAILNAAYGTVYSGRDPAAARAGASTVLRLARVPDRDDRERLGWLRIAAKYAEMAVRRNPRDTANYVLLATVQGELAAWQERLGDMDDARRTLREATDNWDRAVELYPTNPRTRISAGQAWLAWWEKSGDQEAARQAREHLEAALRIDACRPVDDAVRLRPRELAVIDTLWGRLSDAGAPATGRHSSPEE